MEEDAAPVNAGATAADQPIAASGPSELGAASVLSTPAPTGNVSAATPTTAVPPATSAATPETGSAQLVEGAVSILRRMPASMFSMADLVFTLATKEEAKDRKVVLSALVERLRFV